jgi:hypothetical protein
MYDMPESPESARQAEIMDRLQADAESLAELGIRLTQIGPDRESGKVHVYLARYSGEAHQLLEDRYGDDIIVKTESRMWSALGDAAGQGDSQGDSQPG